MAFSTQRGRPRKPMNDNDPGTPEPIDICLEKGIITTDQHWCGLHLRWLYTVRYGAPSITTHYTDNLSPGSPSTQKDPEWQQMREHEYTQAVHILHRVRRYECVMRLAVYNESPAFLDPKLLQNAGKNATLATRLARAHSNLDEGLSELVRHWRRNRTADLKATPKTKATSSPLYPR